MAETKNDAAFKELYARIQDSKATHVYLDARHLPLFNPPPKDGRVYLFKDENDPNVMHKWDAQGQYHRMASTDALATLLIPEAGNSSQGRNRRQSKPSMPKGKRHSVNHSAWRGQKQSGASPVESSPPLVFIDIEQVEAKIGFKKTFIYKQLSEGDFPTPIKLGKSRKAAVRWVMAEVEQWMHNLKENRVFA
ncbi:AlpA family phage regulatory protein [Limnohabitans sp.]|uniref:helix-turn-helix transcriptional regulator n=1 Tax=Limnohabitans sp. TaxID=1907725 RepID=UPI00286F104E|nr:AlpA family phage regulatory protein [Limnohabitans sp.]